MNRTGLLKTSFALCALLVGLGWTAPEPAAAQDRFDFAPESLVSAGDPTDPEDALATPLVGQLDTSRGTRPKVPAVASVGSWYERLVTFLMTFRNGTVWEPRR